MRVSPRIGTLDEPRAIPQITLLAFDRLTEIFEFVCLEKIINRNLESLTAERPPSCYLADYD